ncbi:type IV pilus biogenesis family protein [Pseudomonas fluorescens]|uniref:Type IV pilus biogenesis family protein n=1 Tax=Pseudomonas fluorescens TaxID=294 RepID=A0A0P8WRN5_PSEFL|nr:hypothetical protein [Pseudomonas fluorescens]KPU55469.1 type IV pilus biogenesis family protein [Pseudomonas fluorescens]
MLMFSLERLNGLALRLCNASLLVAPLVFGGFLGWQEWRYREQLVLPMPVETSRIAPAPRPALDATAVATVLGLTAGAELLPSAEPLTLQASFVVIHGLSRVLLADSQGARIYQVGERLPGGSVLRRIETDHAVLWSKGREELLTLQPPATGFLQRLDSHGKPQAPSVSPRFFSPLAGQPE